MVLQISLNKKKFIIQNIFQKNKLTLNKKLQKDVGATK